MESPSSLSRGPCCSRHAAASTTDCPTLRLLSFSGTSRGPSPVTLASQDALPIAVAFTESVNAYFKGADPTKWVSHDAFAAQRSRQWSSRTHIFVHIWTGSAITIRRRELRCLHCRHWISILIPLRALEVECFALAWHHSFRADNLREVDYSLGQRKHTGFYWPTAA